MSFREKSAWITLISVVLCCGGYYGALGTHAIEPYGMGAFHFALFTIIALVLLQIGLHYVARRSNPRDAAAPRDEREEIFELRSRSIGYYVLVLWMIGIVVAVHFEHVRKLDVVFIAMFGIAVAAVAVAVAQIVQYRRGA